jgi:signal transduction histidine kinase/ActR/RegA family two-component response regulator
MDEITRLKQQLERETRARKDAERQLEEKRRELFLANRKEMHAFDNLEKLIQQRTQELSKAVERAEAANHVRNGFLATVSHEIRFPLSNVLGVIDDLLAGMLNEEQTQQLTIIQSSLQELLSLLNDLLDFSRMESGSLTLAQEPFRLADVFSGTLQLFIPTAQRKGIMLSSKYDLPKRLMVQGDEARLRQVLLNLLANALKFTEQGKISLKARLTYQSTAHVGLRVEIADTGIGLPEEVRAHLFKSLHDPATPVPRPGGLGLAMCAQIVHLFGGEIGCRSEPGKGSVFWFEVPFSLATTASPAASSQPPVPTTALHILIVEDNPINQKVATLLFSTLGQNVSVASNGLEALAALQTQSFDLVLLDLYMPQMNGFDTIHAIRSLDSMIARIPIIVLTTDVSDETLERCLDCGVNGFLSKPFTREKAELLLESWHDSAVADA